MALTKIERRTKIKMRVRKIVTGTADRPRMSVFRSNKEIYAQLIDDVQGVTLLMASSKSKDIAGREGTKTEKSAMVGKTSTAVTPPEGAPSRFLFFGGRIIFLLAMSHRQSHDWRCSGGPSSHRGSSGGCPLRGCPEIHITGELALLSRLIVVVFCFIIFLTFCFIF